MSAIRSRNLAWLAMAVALAVALTWLAVEQFNTPPSQAHGHGATTPTPSASSTAKESGAATVAAQRPLRSGERRISLRIPQPYTPRAPQNVGTDDYHCFLLDPKLTRQTDLTGYDVLPDNPDVVHHVILFRVPPASVQAAEDWDDATPGLGWTCFGDSGVPQNRNLDDAPWLGAWAPGGKERIFGKGLAVPLEKGSRIIVQMHYNLLAGPSADQSGVSLRVARHRPSRQGLHTMLLPAPVELPCRDARGGQLCTRKASMAETKARFGQAGQIGDALHWLCGPVKPGTVQSCTRNIAKPMTVRAVAGHMHLLGRQISITWLPSNGKPRELLRINNWNFDDQGSIPIKPVTLQPFDKLKVTCRHAQWPRDGLSAFENQRDDRYVVWGEGTTDEMCLGIVTVTY